MYKSQGFKTKIILKISVKFQINEFQKEEMDQLAFMEEVERDALRRSEERKERQTMAQNLRK